MVNVVSKMCGDEGCSTRPSYGVAGSRKAKFCSKHAKAGMVNVVSKMCGDEGCFTHPVYGVAGSKKAEFCATHATAGMVNVVNKKCGNEGYSTRPSYGVAGSRRGKKCGDEGCSQKPSFGLVGSRKAEFCSEHARAAMVTVVNEKCSEQGCSKFAVHKKHSVGKGTFCPQHANAHNTDGMSDTTKLNSEKDAYSRSPAEGGGGSVADARGTKRKRAAFLGPVGSDAVGAHRRGCAGLRQGVRTPLLLGYPPSRADGEMTLGAGAGMKVELAVPSHTHAGDGVRRCREQDTSSSVGSSKRTGWLSTSPAVVHGRMGVFDYVVFEEAGEDSNVKLELGVSTPSPRTPDTW
ncbi:unnamed protein product [Sphacelaria rigidula]